MYKAWSESRGSGKDGLNSLLSEAQAKLEERGGKRRGEIEFEDDISKVVDDIW